MASAHPSSASRSGTATEGFGVHCSGCRRWKVCGSGGLEVTKVAAHVPKEVDLPGGNVCNGCSHRVASVDKGFCYVPAHPCVGACHQNDGLPARLQALDRCHRGVHGSADSPRGKNVARRGCGRGGEGGVDLRRQAR